jgi:hypothetical protein
VNCRLSQKNVRVHILGEELQMCKKAGTGLIPECGMWALPLSRILGIIDEVILKGSGFPISKFVCLTYFMLTHTFVDYERLVARMQTSNC